MNNDFFNPNRLSTYSLQEEETKAVLAAAKEEVAKLKGEVSQWFRLLDCYICWHVESQIANDFLALRFWPQHSTHQNNKYGSTIMYMHVGLDMLLIG